MALIIGGVALIAALTALGLVFVKTAPSPEKEQELSALKEQVQQLSAQLEQTNKELAAKGAVDRDIRKLQSDLSALTSSAQKNLNELGQAIMQNRNRIQSQGENLVTIVEKVTEMQSPAARPAPTASTPQAATVQASGDAIIHTIRPGDSFSVLSKQYGVSVYKIQEANEGVNPRRLQIGQEIVIPKTQ